MTDDDTPAPAPSGPPEGASLGISTRAPGWYEDPLDAGQVRWWTGRDWSEHTRSRPPLGPLALQQDWRDISQTGSYVGPTGSNAPVSLAAGGQPIYVNVAGRQKRPVNHALHLVLSIVTFGLWLPVWLIIAVAA